MTPLRLALVGTGRIAGDWLRVVRDVPALRLVAVADAQIELARAVAESHAVPAFGSIDELAAAVEIDAAIVAVPPSSHEEVSIRALDAGAHVLCEKPFALDLASAERMFAAADVRERHLTMSAKFRHVPDVIAAKARLDAGAVGRPLFVRQTFGGVVPMEGRWNADRAVSGGGVWIDNGTHSVDLLRYLFGPLAWVQASSPQNVQPVHVEDSIRVVCGFDATRNGDAGVTAVIDTSWSVPATDPFYLECFGTAGSLHLGWSESVIRNDARREHRIGDGYEKLVALRGALAHFVAAATGVETPVLSRDDIRASVVAVEAAYRSCSRNGSRVDIRGGLAAP
ncbi:MAG: Gfo/Idh/MocA family oxidoreductase [Planctomycetes bacterium]|nr:Gfo/Idh/MocA family oxidoreductase [Planctomycetota bacterium]